MGEAKDSEGNFLAGVRRLPNDGKVRLAALYLNFSNGRTAPMADAVAILTSLIHQGYPAISPIRPTASSIAGCRLDLCGSSRANT